MTTDPTFLFCNLPCSKRASLTELMAPLLKRLPKDKQDILSDLSAWQLGDDLHELRDDIKHSFWCKTFGGKCTCKRRYSQYRIFKNFLLCDKQNGCVTHWSPSSDGISGTWGDNSRSWLSGDPQLGIVLWVPIGNGVYEWSISGCPSFLPFPYAHERAVIMRRGLGRIEWNSDHTVARLLKVS